MKFLVTRTSAPVLDDPAPCKGAFRETYISLDVRTVNDPAKLKIGGDDWYKLGANHRVEHGCIVREFEREAWFIEIADLDALIKFYQENGNLVITGRYDSPTITELEIYDDYRE